VFLARSKPKTMQPISKLQISADGLRYKNKTNATSEQGPKGSWDTLGCTKCTFMFSKETAISSVHLDRPCFSVLNVKL
jgi:hypothetical protein